MVKILFYLMKIKY